MAWNRLRGNFLSGQIADSPLLVGATTLTSPGLASLPVIANGDYMVLVIDPSGTGGPPEIVYVTAHASLGETATILRSQEGSGAREHAATTTWINSPTAYDFRGIGRDAAYASNRPGTTHALDDEFDNDVLDPAFVRVDSPSAAHLTWVEAGDTLTAHHTGTDSAAGYHALLKPHDGAFVIGNSLDTCLTYLGSNLASPMAGVMLTDGTTVGAGAQIVGAYWNNTAFPGKSLGLRRGTNFNTDNIAGVSIAPGAAAANYRIHIRVTWVAANSFQFWFSNNGRNWYALAAAAAMTCTPTHIGLFITSWTAASDFEYTYEYLRVS